VRDTVGPIDIVAMRPDQDMLAPNIAGQLIYVHALIIVNVRTLVYSN
jgi:hypothetical protein